MIRLRWPAWRRDLLVSLLASLVTASALLPFAWSAVVDVDMAAGQLTIGRNGEENRQVAIGKVTGLAVLNTR